LTLNSLSNSIKPIITVIYFAFFLSNTGYCQHWQDIAGYNNGSVNCFYEDTIDGVLYVGGNFSKIGGLTIKYIAKWDGMSWDSVPTSTLITTNCETVCALVKYKGELYAGGAAGFTSTRGGIAKWNGTVWEPVGEGTNGIVNKFVVRDSNLYVFGMFDSVASIQANGLAIWNGSVWSDVHALPDYFSPNQVYALEFFNGEIYIGGNFSGPDGKRDIARWNGSSWQDVGGGLFGGWSSVSDMMIYKDKLYIAGSFSKYADSRNPGNCIAAWDGNSWSDAGGGVTGIGGITGQIRDLIIYDGELYVAGSFTNAGGAVADCIAKWDGLEWCGLGSTFDNILSNLSIYQEMLYIAGGFRKIDNDSIRHIAKWTGGSYVDSCGSISGIEKLQGDKQKLIIYPNPFNSATTLRLPDDIKNGNISIYDILGKKVKQLGNLNGNNIIISREGLSNGIYIYRVSEGNNVIGHGKMLLE
jgi:hypothetical protein